MNDLLTIGLILVAWVALNRWILPAMGIETCMSGGCCGGSCRVPAERDAPSLKRDQVESNGPEAAQNEETANAK